MASRLVVFPFVGFHLWCKLASVDEVLQGNVHEGAFGLLSLGKAQRLQSDIPQIPPCRRDLEHMPYARKWPRRFVTLPAIKSQSDGQDYLSPILVTCLSQLSHLPCPSKISELLEIIILSPLYIRSFFSLFFSSLFTFIASNFCRRLR